MRAAKRRGLLVALALGAALGWACGDDEAPETVAPAATPEARLREAAASVDDARLRAADAEAHNWLSHGRTYDEQRYSPLAGIHAGNAANLKLAWQFDTGLTRGHEATPLVVDGVMYLTGSWSVVFALDAASGELRWKYDPQVPREAAHKACCDVVNRGVALYRGRVYVGTLDGRLVALDAATGELAFEVMTVDPTKAYTVTGAPRVVAGKVIIGNGGAEYGVRGYVSAYDPGTGELVWRTYTVPGDPSQPFESEALERAADTWKGGEWWKVGGGGTVWDSMAYDPELGLLYVGTGNGSPWTKYLRSPGGGDNLYLSSILALDPETGEIRWHYQTTPGDNWDYTATQHLILADLEIGGAVRKVILQAPKNGFFYVLDRETGEFLSAEKFVTATWADRIDPETGRPVPNESGEYKDGTAVVMPWYLGGHNWHPMSFNPVTGLVYIPAQEAAAVYGLDRAFRIRDGFVNTGTDFSYSTLFQREAVSGHLLAWDPVAQREVWRHPHGLPWNGGTLTTAGNLVFQGTADGRFLALKADDGKLLWTSHSAGTGIIAAPVSYQVGATQYVSVVAGWGGAFALIAGDAAAAAGVTSRGRVLAYTVRDEPLTVAAVESLMAARNPEEVRGSDLYHTYCAGCHGANAIGAGVNPDLRDSAARIGVGLAGIIRQGIPGTGMPGFGQWLEDADVEALVGYLELRARE
ncbi:MAG: PQQ-dependent dehydrogenase, methanol/ethanol family [Proteobacteria bacterium]|nr:PQQ-dependent dehydrogenase, methanol/ethanol family [Pseudomonadota bacterium]